MDLRSGISSLNEYLDSVFPIDDDKAEMRAEVVRPHWR